MRRIFQGMFHVALGFLVLTPFFGGETAFALDPGCTALSKEIDTFVLGARDRAVLERLAPYISANVVPALVARAQSATPDVAFAVLVAAGRSGHADALRQIKSFKPGLSLEMRAARSVALLALGDGSETATISVALESGPRELRLNVARALARMRHPRPRELLRSALDDPEPEVRLTAAEGLVVVRSMKGRRVLLELSRAGPEPLKSRAARVLGASRWAAAHLDSIDEALVGRAEARMAAHGRKDITRRARLMLASSIDAERSGAFAALAVSAEETPATLEKLAKKAVEKVGGEAEAELLMAQALMGQTSAIDRLSQISPAFAANAVAVFWNAAGASDPETAIIGGVVPPLLSVIERWVITGALNDADAVRAIDAAVAIGNRSARSIARARILGPDGQALRASIRALGEVGGPEDVRSLTELARRGVSEETRVEAYRAADRICAE